MTTFIAALILYILAGTLIALASSRLGVRSAEDYIKAGGRVGGLLSFASYAAATYSAFMMIGLVGLTYATGAGALGFELSYLLATVILLSTAGYKIWSLSRKRGWMTPPQMLRDLYSSKLLGLLTTGLYIIAMIPYIAAQIQGLTVVFNYAGFNPELGVVVSAIIAYLWILSAGMWSLATTGLYRDLVTLAGSIVFITGLLDVSGVTALNALSTAGEKGYLGLTGFWTPQVFLAYTTPWVFFAVTNPQVVVKLFIQRDSRAYKRSVVFFAVFGLAYTLMVVIAGLIARGLTEMGLLPLIARRDDVTVCLLSRFFDPVSSSLIAVSITAAAVSVTSNIIHVIASSIYSELTGRVRSNPLLVLNVLGLAVTAVSSTIAYARVSHIVDLSVMTSVFLLPLAPLTLLGVYFEKHVGRYTRTASIISLVTGAGIAGASTLINGARNAFTAVYMGIPVSLWVLVASTIVFTVGLILDSAIHGKQSLKV